MKININPKIMKVPIITLRSVLETKTTHFYEQLRRKKNF